jgi:site-specific DNA recombinase
LIYPEKLVFNGFQYRTSRINEAVRLIYALDKGFSGGAKIKKGEKSPDSGVVASTGIEPASGASEALILSIVLRG